MSFYESAIDKIHAFERNRDYLNSYEYRELMDRASVTGSYGNAARNALSLCRSMDWKPFALVGSRDRAKEEEYAKMGSYSGGSSPCFLTTACMEKLRDEFDDNCRELTVLRRYRDSWLREHHPEDIELYYHVAPVLVEEVDRREDSRAIWLSLYEDSILPAVRAAEAGEDEEAYRIYRAMVEDLLDRFAPLPF